EITDNGVRFDTDGPRKPQSFGLVGIRERALATGGEVAVSSAPGRGTTVRVYLPVRGSQGEES
ncbi:MAG: histidine kinase, partial [Sterolibacterium sp.]